MARPSFQDLVSGTQNWDSIVNNNKDILSNGPFPLFQHTGDQTDLESTFPAASYDRCIIWVNHSTEGWKIYWSNGTAWAQLDNAI